VSTPASDTGRPGAEYKWTLAMNKKASAAVQCSCISSCIRMCSESATRLQNAGFREMRRRMLCVQQAAWARHWLAAECLP
jgi:hypothetical protein